MSNWLQQPIEYEGMMFLTIVEQLKGTYECSTRAQMNIQVSQGHLKSTYDQFWNITLVGSAAG